MENGRSAVKENFDVLVVGAGPTGLACAIEAQRAGMRTVLVDKGCLCNSLFHYPSNMTFFTTPELLEIGDMPFSSPNTHPQPQRGAGVLPQGGGALPVGDAPLSNRIQPDRGGWRFQHHHCRPVLASAV